MKFTLIYDGDLPSNGNTKEKWKIRKAFDPQLRELWQESEILRSATKYRLVPATTSYFRLETHHSVEDAPGDKRFAGPDMPKHPERIDLCAPIARAGLWRVDLDESARRSGWEIGDRGVLSMPVLFVAGKG